MSWVSVQRQDYDKLESRVLAAMNGEMSEDVFNGLAIELYQFQRSHNRPYRIYCEEVGAPARVENWRQIPAVPQSAFRRAALRVFPEDATVRIFRTSGTTGEGFGSHHFCSLRAYEASVVGGWRSLKIPLVRRLMLVPTASAAPHSSLSYMMSTLGGAFFWSAMGLLDVAGLRRASTDEIAPVMLVGTALTFLHLFEELGGAALALPPGSFALETGGYKGSGRELRKQELYRLFARHLGLDVEDIYNEYGMTELSSQFYARGLHGLHRGPPWTRAVVIDPETGGFSAEGEIGVLRIYDLANIGSVIGIETRDLAVQREGGFELIGRDPTALPRGCSRSADELLMRR